MNLYFPRRQNQQLGNREVIVWGQEWSNKSLNDSVFSKAIVFKCFPGNTRGKEATCQCRKLGFNLSQEDTLEKEMATHSSILAWKILWTKEPGKLQPTVLQRVRRNWAHYILSAITFIKMIRSLLHYNELIKPFK